MTLPATPADIIQVNTLTFAPYGNENRDEAGHPKTMNMLGTLRGRWSTQSQKAALRASPHLSPAGCGIRSRNLAIETFERLAAAGLPERLCCAAAELVRAGLGNGSLRTPRETVDELVKIRLNKKDFREFVATAFPKVKLPAPKNKKNEGDQADGSEPEVKEAGASNLKTQIADLIAPKDASLSYRIGRANSASWPSAWALDMDVVGALSGGDEDLRKELLTVFRAEQPLLFSTLEVAWKDGVVSEAVLAWSQGGAAAVGETLERLAPGGKVGSPMPKVAIDIDIAMFGRMVASLPDATVEGGMRIAHSMTVGEFQIEADFFTAREERPRDGNDNVGHMGHAFWGVGIHHRYLMIDMNVLRTNLKIGGRSQAEVEEMAESALEWVVSAFATTMPGGKVTNSATFSPASYLMIERGSAPSTNLAVAFSKAIPADAADHMAEAIGRMRSFKVALSRVYGVGKIVEVCAYPGVTASPAGDGIASCGSLPEAIKAVAR